MRLLITGASGLLGLNLALDASGSHQVTAVDRRGLSRTPFKLVRADLLEPAETDRALEESNAEAVIHCAAIADVDLCEREPELAQLTNSDLPGRIAEACHRRRIPLVHISTDAVFDGMKAGAYTEADLPNPTGTYARTKLGGEQAVLSANPSAIVARVNFYGWSLSGQRSLAEFFVENLKNGKTVSGFTDVIFCPMFVKHLGAVLIKMIQADLHGLYHVVGSQAMTKYQFGVEIARRFGLPEINIQPQSVDRSPLIAARAHNLQLSIHKLSTDLAAEVPEFSTGLSELYQQYQHGYPQRLRGYQQAPTGETSPSGKSGGAQIGY